MVHAYAARFDNHPQVFNAVTVKLALLWIQIQIIFFETPQDSMRRFSVHSFISAVYQNVIHVNGHLSSRDQICEDRVHERLEGSRRVGEAKVYDMQLEGSLIGDECRFPLVRFLDPDVVVFPPNVEFGEDLSFRQVVDNIRGERQRIAVFDCDRVELAVILYEAKFSIFLLDEEDRGYH